MMDKVKNWELEVRRDKEEAEREHARLREMRASLEREKSEVVEQHVKLKIRLEKLETKEETVSGLEKEYVTLSPSTPLVITISRALSFSARSHHHPWKGQILGERKHTSDR